MFVVLELLLELLLLEPVRDQLIFFQIFVLLINNFMLSFNGILALPKFYPRALELLELRLRLVYVGRPKLLGKCHAHPLD